MKLSEIRKRERDEAKICNARRSAENGNIFGEKKKRRTVKRMKNRERLTSREHHVKWSMLTLSVIVKRFTNVIGDEHLPSREKGNPHYPVTGARN